MPERFLRSLRKGQKVFPPFRSRKGRSGFIERFHCCLVPPHPCCFFFSPHLEVTKECASQKGKLASPSSSFLAPPSQPLLLPPKGLADLANPFPWCLGGSEGKGREKRTEEDEEG